MTQKFKKLLKTLIPILAILLVLGLVIGIIVAKEINKRNIEESYKNMDSQLVISFANFDEPLKFEVGDTFTYNDKKIEELKNIPDQFKPIFKSIPKGATITLDNPDLSLIGIKTINVNLSMTDSYGQEISKKQTFEIEVVDTTEPRILLAASSIKAKNEQEVKDNVQAVIDDVFGEYKYSEKNENHTYYIDMSNIDWSIPGKYKAIIQIFDNGKIIERYFEVAVGDLVNVDDLKAESTLTGTWKYSGIAVVNVNKELSEEQVATLEEDTTKIFKSTKLKITDETCLYIDQDNNELWVDFKENIFDFGTFGKFEYRLEGDNLTLKSIIDNLNDAYVLIEFKK